MRSIIKASVFVVVISLVGLSSINCVSPFYGTARIEPGHNFDVGVAGSSYLYTYDGWWVHNYGGRIDGEWRYSKNPFFGISSRLGLGLGGGQDVYGGIDSPPPVTYLIDPGFGIQFCLPDKTITPALNIECGVSMTEGLTPFIKPGLILGIGKQEFLTLGLRTKLALYNDPLDYGHIFAPYDPDLFLSFHPSEKISIFTGFSLTGGEDFNIPSLKGTIGVGYHIR